MRRFPIVLLVIVALLCVARADEPDQDVDTIKARFISLIRQSDSAKAKKAAAQRAARRRRWRRRRRQRQRRRRQRQARRRRRRERKRAARERRRREQQQKKENKNKQPKTTMPPITTVASTTTQTPTTTAATPTTTTMMTTMAPVTQPPLATTTPPKSSRNPCHSNRSQQNRGQDTCLKYILPKELCTSCPLRKYSRTGYFNNCGRIYDLTSDSCREQLVRYSELNPCDAQRRMLVKDFDNPANEMGLDYFVYSICEMCCDCIPMGTAEGTYDDKKKKGTLMKVDRANCPAHAVADICKVWPNVRAVYSESDATEGKVKPDSELEKNYPVCKEMRSWKARQGQLYKVKEINITPLMRTFMSDFVDAANCRAKSFWNSCTKLENSQNRI